MFTTFKRNKMKKLLIISLFLLITNISYSQQCYGYNCHKRTKGHKALSTLCITLFFTPVVLGIIDYQLNKDK